MDNYTIYFILSLTFLIGISVGSFVTLASYRLPLGKEIVFSPSHCPRCQYSLGFLDLFPLFSWLFQQGGCRYCKARISWRYPLIEAVTGIIFVAIVFFYGITTESLFLLLLVTALLIMIVTDLEHYIIPDGIQVTVLLVGIGWRIFHHDETGEIVIPVVTGLAIGLLLHYGYLYIRKKDALGLGDVKFLGAAGAWLSLTQFIPFLFLAGVTGIISGILWRILGHGKIFPFGPALAVSLFINVLFPDIMGLLQKGLM